MFFIPYTKWTTRLDRYTSAINYWWGIKQKPNLEYGLTVYGQEVVEFFFKFNRALPAAALLTVALGLLLFFATTLSPLLIALGSLVFLWFSYMITNGGIFSKSKELEYIGKAVSLVIAMRVHGVDKAWWLENKSLRSLYNSIAYPQYKGMSKEEILAGILSKEKEAEAWVDKNLPKLTKTYFKHNNIG